MSRTPPLAAQAHLDSPLGPLRLAATERGLAGLWFEGQAHPPGELDAPENPAQVHIARTAAEFQAYWRGEPVAFGAPLDPQGTAFQQQVWQALRALPRGATCSYGELAVRIGRPGAVRAVGAAVGRNPLSIVVPCHRVLGRDGGLTGYAGGLERKRALLRLEGAWPP
jgi:methylated-DNA-[protein]-cysteine S-methyltransferase